MTTATYTVQAMTCNHCVNWVTVTSVQPADLAAIRTAVQGAGYQMVGS